MAVEDEPADVKRVKSSLQRLAGPNHRQVIERADGAIGDLEAAVRFVETVGLTDLEVAVETVDDPEITARGQWALEEFRRFRRVAIGDEPTDHFHPGHGIDLRDDAEGPHR